MLWQDYNNLSSQYTVRAAVEKRRVCTYYSTS